MAIFKGSGVAIVTPRSMRMEVSTMICLIS